MEKFIIKPSRPFGTAFAIVNTLSGTYICPGWHPVPSGTTRDQIEFDMTNYIETKPKEPVKEVTEVKSYTVEASKPGKFYEVKNNNGKWSCTCPSASFHRGDCKHIKKLKEDATNI
jgi:hypothetical protein